MTPSMNSCNYKEVKWSTFWVCQKWQKNVKKKHFQNTKWCLKCIFFASISCMTPILDGWRYILKLWSSFLSISIMAKSDTKNKQFSTNSSIIYFLCFFLVSFNCMTPSLNSCNYKKVMIHFLSIPKLSSMFIFCQFYLYDTKSE